MPQAAKQHWRLRLGSSGPYALDTFAVCLTWLVVTVVAAPMVGAWAALAVAVISAVLAALGARGWRHLRDGSGRWSRGPASPGQVVRAVRELILAAQDLDPEISSQTRAHFLDSARRGAQEVLENPLSTPDQHDKARDALKHAERIAERFDIRPAPRAGL